VFRLKKARIYYSSPKIVVMDDPTNGNSPVIVLRHEGSPTEEIRKEIRRVLKLCGMTLTGISYIREDGLFCQPVKEVSNAEELCH